MTEKASPGDRETWWQQQLDEANESSRNNSRCLEQSIQREEATSRELKKVSESYWNLSRSMKLTQEERDAAEARVRDLTAEKRLNDTDLANWRAAEARLATAVGLLEPFVELYPGYAGPGSLVDRARAFLASAQPAAPSLGHPGADEVFARMQSARQPAATKSVGCDYPASWCLPPGCEKCRATHPGAAQPSSPARATWHGKPTVVWPGIPVLREPAGPRVTSLSWDRTAAPTRTALADALGDVKSGARVAPTRDETDEERAEMAQGFGFGDYATMVRLLARHGWSRTSTRTEAEQAVLDACGGASIEWVQAGTLTPRLSDGSSQTVAMAVLARRGLK